jgi:HK97 family phage portal protein
MGILTRLFKGNDTDKRGMLWADAVQFGTINGGYAASKSMTLSAVYRSVDVISDSVAQLPLEPFAVDNRGYKRKMINKPIYKILNKTPDGNMTRAMFMKMVVSSMLLKGNSYAYVDRYKTGDIRKIVWLPTDSVTVNISKNGGISYGCNRGYGIPTVIDSKNMLHFRNFSYDGVMGISTIEHAKHSIGLAADSEAHAQGFFKGGANLAGILKIADRTTKEQKQAIKDAWQMAFNPVTGNPNGIAIVDGNMDYQPITVTPEDAQLLETRQFNVVDIARFFGVSPVKLFDFSKSSYSTVEATQLAFLTDTLAPLLEKIEQELELKLFPNDNIDVRFDTARLLKGDKTAMASYYSQLVNLGAYTINDVRRELDLTSVEGGDETLVQVNLQKLTDLINKLNTNDGSQNKQDNPREPQD